MGTKHWCSHGWVAGLARLLDRSSLASRDPDSLPLVVRTADGGLQGAAGRKNSQHWPVGFGEAMAQQWQAWQHIGLNHSCIDYTVSDDWGDARLDEVHAVLTGDVPIWPKLPRPGRRKA